MSPCSEKGELNFYYSPFWVQAHGIPLTYLSMENGADIGEIFGQFSEMDWQCWHGQISCPSFLRLRVVVDVRNPLKTGLWLKRKGSPDIWIQFKYENLGIFCYKCGRIGHQNSNCRFPTGENNFGPWLRAERDENAVFVRFIPVPKPKILPILDDGIHDDEDQGRAESGIPPRRDYKGSHQFQTLFSWRRLIVNGLDSMIMLANWAGIMAALKEEHFNKWKMSVLMASYLVHLWPKFILVCLRRRHGGIEFRQLFISLAFLLMFCC